MKNNAVVEEKGLTRVDPFSIFGDMKKITIDQAEIIFSLFVAQNGDGKISEFVKGYDEFCETEDIVNLGTVSDLLLVNNAARYGLGVNLSGFFTG